MTAVQSTFLETKGPSFATLDMISESGRNLMLRPFKLEYRNTRKSITRMAQSNIGSYKRKFLNPNLDMHTRAFDSNFENGNADQVVALVIKHAITNYQLATALFSDGSTRWVASWCWEASDKLIVKTPLGGSLTIPPHLFFEALKETAKVGFSEAEFNADGSMRDESEEVSMQRCYPHAYEAYLLFKSQEG